MSPVSVRKGLYQALVDSISSMRSVVVAYSGGVDSTLVAKAAFDALGNRAVAVTAVSPTIPASELKLARDHARFIGIEHVELDIDELSSIEFTANTPYRCYHCKRLRMAELLRYAASRGIERVIDGSNASDEFDWRPGLKANEELGIASPLAQAGIGKDKVRALLKELSLPNWNKPASPCLASRIPYGSEITKEMLSQIEQAEQAVRSLGIVDCRVRHHGEIARVEIAPSDFEKAVGAQYLIARLKEIGFTYVVLDLEGLRSGSLNNDLAES